LIGKVDFVVLLIYFVKIIDYSVERWGGFVVEGTVIVAAAAVTVLIDGL